MCKPFLAFKMNADEVLTEFLSDEKKMALRMRFELMPPEGE
jgi:hypothetical protein